MQVYGKNVCLEYLESNKKINKIYLRITFFLSVCLDNA